MCVRGTPLLWPGQEGVKQFCPPGWTPSWCPGPSGQPGHLAWQTPHCVPSVPRQSHQEETCLLPLWPVGVCVDLLSVPARPGLGSLSLATRPAALEWLAHRVSPR